MTANTPISSPAPDRLALVTGHQSYRGLTVEQNLLIQFTRYTVELDQLGLFISDSRWAAFDMAFDALFRRTELRAWA